MSVTEKYH
jgi:Ca2+-binding EF-hand superfamily protein